MTAVNQPEDIAEQFISAWNSADANALSALFAEDADFVNVVGLWWEDRERIREAHEYGFRKIFGSSRMTSLRTKHRRLSEESAVVHLEWALNGQADQGEGEAGERRGVFSFVLKKYDDAWLAVSAHNTDRVPATETHIADRGGLRTTSYQVNLKK